MKARLIKNKDKYTLLKCNGSIEEMCFYTIKEFFSSYNDGSLYEGGKWEHKVSMEGYDGETIAFVDDKLNLIIPRGNFMDEFLRDSLIGFIQTEDYAILHNKNHRMVQRFCGQGRFPVVKTIGKAYFLPENAEYPRHAAIKEDKSGK